MRRITIEAGEEIEQIIEDFETFMDGGTIVLPDGETIEVDTDAAEKTMQIFKIWIQGGASLWPEE